MADKDEVNVGDIIEVIVSKPIQGKIGEAYKTQGWAKPNRMGQRAVVSGIKQVSKKTGKINWTTKQDGKVLIKYQDFTHADGFDVPGQTQGKPPVLAEGEWKIIERAEVPKGADRARNDDGEYVGDDINTDDKNEAFVGGFGGIGDSPSVIDTPPLGDDDVDEDLEKPLPDTSDTPPMTGFGVIGGFGSIGGSSTPSNTNVSSTPAPVAKPKKTKTDTPLFDITKAGWLPFENTMQLDMEKIKEEQGGYTLTIAGQTGFKIRVLFSPVLNGFNEQLIDSESKFNAMLTDSANMIMREYTIGENLTKCEIRGSGSKSLKGISQNYSKEGNNEKYPQSPTVQSFNLKWDAKGKLNKVTVTLVTSDDTMQITHKAQKAKWEVSDSSSTSMGFGTVGGIGSSVGSGSAKYTPELDNSNNFYNADAPAAVLQRYDMNLEYDSDNTFFKQLWQPMVVDWDKAPSLPIKMSGGKNIGGYIKISMKCDKVEDVTDRIPGVWVGYNTDSSKREWSKAPRRVTLIMPKADDSNMYWMDDEGNKMSSIDEIKYHEIKGKIHSVRLSAQVERVLLDETGNAITDSETFEIKKETITQLKIIEKSRTETFEVKNRIGKQGYSPLEGEIESIKVYSDGDCSSEWSKWLGQRESLLTFGEQTLTWLKWRDGDEESLYIIVGNDKSPNTGQLIVLTKKTLAEGEEEMNEEVEQND